MIKVNCQLKQINFQFMMLPVGGSYNENLLQSLVQIHNFHALTTLYRYISIICRPNIDPSKDQQPLGLIVQLVEHCNGIA